MPGYFEAMLQRGEVSSECAHQIELVRLQTLPVILYLITHAVLAPQLHVQCKAI